jgi:hypothetical protein
MLSDVVVVEYHERGLPPADDERYDIAAERKARDRGGASEAIKAKEQAGIFIEL